jgi:murein L,D-transpeptidase YafK
MHPFTLLVRSSMLIALLAVYASCHDLPSQAQRMVQAVQRTSNAERPPLAELVDSLKLDPAHIRFVVYKERRAFHVVHGRDTLCTFPCVLGEQPMGDKHMQGDRRTPEGTFGIRSKRRHERWHAFVWVDYPNAESWRRFKERKKSGSIPPEAEIGGEIGIHGVPEGRDHWILMGVDWTFGCIALRNPDLDEVYPFIRPGTTMLQILP